MDSVNQSLLPFFITAPGESDILFTAVTVFLILVVLGFGAIYFTIQAIPDRRRPGTIMVVMEPIFAGHADAVLPGSTCVGVAYTSRAAQIEAGEITGFNAFIAALVDGMGIANAIVIRAQALLLPIRVLVFS